MTAAGHDAARLVIRDLLVQDESSAIRAHRALEPEDFPFLFDFTPGDDFAAYVRRTDAFNAGAGPWSEGGVRGCFLVGEMEGELVGRVSVRYALNDYLALYGGHIGYCTIPTRRRRGFATRLLEVGLERLRARGTRPILLTCDEHNHASQALIERAGGRFVKRTDANAALGEAPKHHYHFD